VNQDVYHVWYKVTGLANVSIRDSDCSIYPVANGL